MAAPDPSSYAVTQFNAVFETPWRPGVVLPVLTLMLNEDRSGGWSGTVQINPRRSLPEDALQTLMADGLVPGTAATVKLVIAGSTGHSGTAVRVWPSVVTSVNCTTSDAGTTDALCMVTFRDPVTYLRNRPIWTAFADCALSEMVGGALSVAAGGDGKPTRMPLLSGLPAVEVEESLRDELTAIPYAIAAGEPFGYWLNRLFGRLGTRLELLGEPSGVLKASVLDCAPTETVLNRDGGVDMTFDPALPASATNLTLSGMAVNSGIPRRGGMLDNPSSGGVRRFGPSGAIESATIASEMGVQEAELRAGFPQANRRLAQVRATVTSCQPGLLPGRVVILDSAANLDLETGADVSGDEAKRSHPAILGARRWQTIDVAHLFLHGRYWNQASFEKIGLAWHPGPPDERGAAIISGVVDDGRAEAGELIDRDRLGRVPVRFPFVVDVGGDGAGQEASETTADASDVPWPPCIPLSPITPGAGNLHGFVSDHRQGDWCRVAVVDPLYAEIVGFCHRDDRFLGERVRDGTVGIVVREGGDEWRGMVFRPDDDLEEEPESGNE